MGIKIAQTRDRTREIELGSCAALQRHTLQSRSLMSDLVCLVRIRCTDDFKSGSLVAE